MNEEWLQECSKHIGELRFPSLPWPLHQPTFLHIMSTDIINAAQDIIPAAIILTPTLCFNDCPAPPVSLLCVLAVSLPVNLACNMDCAALVHAVHLDTKILHSTLSISAFETCNGIQPDLSHLCAYSFSLTSKDPNQLPARLRTHTCHGIYHVFEGSSQ